MLATGCQDVHSFLQLPTPGDTAEAIVQACETLKIRWKDNIPDTEVQQREVMQSAHTLLNLAQLGWTGHVTRLPNERLPKRVYYGELQVGKRSKDGQKKRYKNTLKSSLKDFNMPPESWEQLAHDRAKWHCLSRKGADDYDAKRACEAERKHKTIKENTNTRTISL